MAYRHTTTRRVSTQPKPLSEVRLRSLIAKLISPQYAATLFDYSKTWGVPLEEILGESLTDHIDTCLSAREEANKKAIRSADRVERKATQRREETLLLCQLERDLRSLPSLA